MIGIPKTQKIWVSYINEGKITHVVTSTASRDKYFLYEINQEGKFIKSATARQPIFKKISMIKRRLCVTSV